MTNETMTVHRALAELKTMDARIDKAIQGASYVTANKHSNQKISGVSIQEFCDIAKSSWQSAKDLIARRNAIKRAVVLSNAQTNVVIGDKTYTVAEAIEMKNQGIEYLRDMLNKLNSDYVNAKRTAERYNGDVLERRTDDYIATMFGSDSKVSSEEINKARADFIASQTYELIDPIKATDCMRALEEEINDFWVNVDAALSVSNATTQIEISY